MMQKSLSNRIRQLVWRLVVIIYKYTLILIVSSVRSLRLQGCLILDEVTVSQCHGYNNALQYPANNIISIISCTSTLSKIGFGNAYVISPHVTWRVITYPCWIKVDRSLTKAPLMFSFKLGVGFCHTVMAFFTPDHHSSCHFTPLCWFFTLMPRQFCRHSTDNIFMHVLDTRCMNFAQGFTESCL